MKRAFSARLAQLGCSAMAVINIAIVLPGPVFAQQVASPPLRLSGAIELALDNNPGVAASLAEVDALEAEAASARRWENPVFGTTVEDFGGDRNGWNNADTTVSISQVVPLGGDRVWAYRTQRALADAAAIESATARAALISDTARAIITAFTASEIYTARQELRQTAQQAADAINARVDAGRASPIERRRAEILIARASIALAEAERAKTGAMQNLAAIWGAVEFNREIAPPLGELDLEAISSISVDDALSANLALERLRVISNARSLQVRSEQASAVPDVTIGAGVRRSGASDEFAYLATIELPIPLINQNREGIRAALSRENGARLNEDAARRTLLGNFAQAMARFSQAELSLTQLEQSVFPASLAAFAAAQEAYGEGAMNVLDFLDIQRTYFDVRLDLIDARMELALAAVEIDQLAGAPTLNRLASATREEE